MPLDPLPRRFLAGVLLSLSATTLRGQLSPAAAAAAPRSAPLANLHYQVTFDSARAAARAILVTMSFDVTGPGPVLLSLPAWTPGSYEIDNFARRVVAFTASGAAGVPLDWDKLDPDTWRVASAGTGPASVSFVYAADTLDNAMAWARPDFAFFIGTNLFLYPEGRGFDFPATVTVETQPGWLVVTGMRPAGPSLTYTERNYHDLVDMPFFVGRMDVDSNQVVGRRTRLATYPAGAMTGLARTRIWEQISRAIPVEAAVFQETPWETYTVFMVFDSSTGGGSALEHQNSHLGIYNPGFIGNPLLASITAHEIFHAWNVKRLRPADLVPYRYDRPEPTPWLWVSEGITDYYSDLAMVRGGVIDSAQFVGVTGGKIGEVLSAPPTALEDASLSTWIDPVDGTRYLYYPKGSLAGLLLDITIRDASDNRRSLDDVMRELYRTTFKRGRGFTATDWWGAVSRAGGGRDFTDFAARYVDGREPMPFTATLALAGLRLATDTVRQPRLGVATTADSGGITVQQVQPGTAAAEAGVRPGDRLLALGDVHISNPDFGPAYRARFGRSTEGDSFPITVRRGGDTVRLSARVHLVTRLEARLDFDPTAPSKAVRIRTGIMKGKTGS